MFLSKKITQLKKKISKKKFFRCTSSSYTLTIEKNHQKIIRKNTLNKQLHIYEVI